jgi:Domain of unknown function (DUF4149)
MEAKLDAQPTKAGSLPRARATADATPRAAPFAALGVARLLLVGLWLGAAMFFSFAVAPGAFAVLPARELAGAIVTRTISVVNVAGLVVGLLLLATAFVGRSVAAKRAWLLEVCALALMSVATCIGHWVISARMQALRLSMGRPIDELAQNDPLRLAFNDLHGYSVAAMTTAMVAALVAFILIARRNVKSQVPSPKSQV